LTRESKIILTVHFLTYTMIQQCYQICASTPSKLHGNVRSAWLAWEYQWGRNCSGAFQTVPWINSFV